MSSGSFTPFETFKKKRARSRRHFFPAGHTLFCFVRFSWGLFCNEKTCGMQPDLRSYATRCERILKN
jgi:hypothetical protein